MPGIIGTNGDDLLTLAIGDPYTDAVPSLVDGRGGLDTLRLLWAGAPLELDLSAPSTVRIIPIAGRAGIPIVGVERLDHSSGPDAPSTIRGGSYDDTLIGGFGRSSGSVSDLLDGGGGNDVLRGDPVRFVETFGENDLLDGGAGNDSLTDLCGDFGEDTYSGGDGRDVFVMLPTPAASDLYYAMYGRPHWNDVISDFRAGTDGDVIAWSDVHRDAYHLGALEIVQDGADTVIRALVRAPTFNSHPIQMPDLGWIWEPLVTLQNFEAAALVPANFDRHAQVGPSHDDSLRGTVAADVLNGGFGADDIAGGKGDDTLRGGQRRDTIVGNAGDDLLQGGYGDDLLSGVDGDDRLLAGFGDDKLFGGMGRDRLSGEVGRDSLFGGAGDDRLDGGRNADRLSGDAGNDTLIGGSGNDTLRGGDGDDVFSIGWMQPWNEDTVVIEDFVRGEDLIDVGFYGIEDVEGLRRDAGLGGSIDAAFTLLGSVDDFERESVTVVIRGIDGAALTDSDFIF